MKIYVHSFQEGRRVFDLYKDRPAYCLSTFYDHIRGSTKWWMKLLQKARRREENR